MQHRSITWNNLCSILETLPVSSSPTQSGLRDILYDSVRGGKVTFLLGSQDGLTMIVENVEQ